MGDVDVIDGGFAWPASNQPKACTDVARLPGLPLGAASGLARYRSDSAAMEPRLSICSISGTVYESVVVVGHMHGTDNVVYYLLEVRSWETPLEGYVVRRRYNDFRSFHHELAKCMPSQRHRSSSVGLGLFYSSLLCNPLTRSTPETSPLWSPPTHDGRAPAGMDQRRSSWISDGSGSSQQVEDDTRSSAPAVLNGEFRPNGGAASYDSNAVLPLDAVKFNLGGRPWLPAMPSGGLLTMLTTRHALIQYRIEQFNHILAAVMSDKSSDVARLLKNFIQDKPGAQARTYTNLSDYAAMDIPINIERCARRRAMSIGKHQPGASPGR